MKSLENDIYNIAILGFGIVGRGVYDILKSHDNINVSYVFVRQEKIKKLYEEIKDVNFTDDLNEIMQDEDVDIIVECLGGVDLSFKSYKMA